MQKPQYSLGMNPYHYILSADPTSNAILSGSDVKLFTAKAVSKVLYLPQRAIQSHKPTQIGKILLEPSYITHSAKEKYVIF
jgi:hypothetical protein